MTTPRKPGEPRSRAIRARLATACSVGVAILLSACRLPNDHERSRRAPAIMATEAVLASVQGSGEDELYHLELQGDSNGALLRRAWIRCQQGQLGDAEMLVERLLYRYPAPSPSAEALARYVRAEIRRAQGQPERADLDLERARELAVDPALRARLGTDRPVVAVAKTTEPSTGETAFYPRHIWNPKPAVPSRLDSMGRIFRITVHHSAVALRRKDVASAKSAIRRIQKEHMDGRGFGDIGYHYLIDPSGRVWAGRELKWQGAHARGRHNTGNIGICVLGSFIHGPKGQAPSSAQVVSLTALIKLLRQQFVVPASQLHTHREFVATECPGERLQQIMNRLRGNLTTAAKE